MNIVRKILSRWFGVRYALLFDFDGQVTITRVRQIGNGHICGRRHGDKVFLQPDGTVKGKCYVDRWEPLLLGPATTEGEG